MKQETKFIHAGSEPDPSTGAIMTPIYQTSTFVQESPGVHKGYEYARTQNPTRHALQNALAIVENGKFGLCFASGSAAADAVIKLLNPGDEVIAANDMYGGTYRLFTKIFEKYGLKFHFINMQDANEVSKAINKNTRLIWTETPTNPMMNITDIDAVAAIAKKNNILLCVDNTFASPYLQNPLDLGADIVLHSATKYIGGHSDSVHGCLIVNDEELKNKLAFIQNSCGAIPGPQDCFLILRGLKTLHVRMKRHCENGEKVVEYLSRHPKINRVYYPGLENHPFHEIAKKQMKAFGGMVSFTFKSGKKEDSIAFLEKLKVFTLAESLGGVESLANHPALMTHASIPADKRAEVGITDDLVRLSVGIEDAEDLIADLEQALA